MSVQSKAEVSIYETDGEDASPGGPKLKLESHWNQSTMVVLRFPRAKPITVCVADLLEAIRRCSR